MDRQQASQPVAEIRKASSSGIAPEIISMKLRLPLRLVRRVLAGRMTTKPFFSSEKPSSHFFQRYELMSTDNQQPATVSSLVMAKAGDPVPAGQYKARFLRCEESAGNPAYGPAYRWAWEVLEGEFASREISTITSQKVNPQSNSGKLIALLNGSPVDSDQTVDLQAFVGQTYLCSVVESGSGTKVDTVFKI